MAVKKTRTRGAKPQRSDLLIIECDSDGLARDAMNLGTWFGRIMSVALKEKRIALIQTSTEAKLEEELTAVFEKFGYFRSVLIVGHSDPNSLVLTRDCIASWAKVGKLLGRFRPTHLFLVACEAGRSEAVREVFKSAKSLREIYASPVPLLKIHTAPMGVLIFMLLRKRRLDLEESAGLRIASFISWGIQTYCWRREELGPGTELQAQFWDALATRLGLTNWDLIGWALKATGLTR